jgi:hypothetical protein
MDPIDEQHEQHKQQRQHKIHKKPRPEMIAMNGSGIPEDIVTITFHFLPKAVEGWCGRLHSSEED